MSIFKDDLDNWSSKRTVGLSYAALGFIMVIAGIFLSGYKTDINILIVVITTALTALGIAAIPKKLNTSSTVDGTKTGGGKT